MRRILSFLLFCCLIAVQQTAQAQACNTPVINSVSPNTGYIGSTVVINGANFDANPANNQVFFGATKANIISSSFSTLTVTVPIGTTYAPISVKNGCGLISASTIPFNGIFCGTNITSDTYNTVSYSANVSGGYQMLSQDMDLDGKPDVLVCGFTTNKVSIMRNLSTPGNFDFATKFDLDFSGATRCIAPADYDGDGKIDLIVVDNGINGVRIFRNTSVPNALSFATSTTIPNIGGYQCAAGDLNNDGKLDLVVGSGSDVITFRNTSTAGNISFVQSTSINVGGFVTGLVVTDVDGDGVKDIGTADASGNKAIAVRNTTTANATTFSFGALQSYTTGDYPYRLFVGDFDKDGKIDFVTNDHSGATVSVFRNTSSQGAISFENRVVLSSPSSNYRIGVGDADGDGRPDIVTKSSGENLFSVYKNVSTGAGNIAFNDRLDYPGQAEVSGVVIADLDGDYVPDISTSGTGYNTLRVHRNNSTVTDNTLPTASCKNIIAGLNPNGTVTITAQMIDNGSSDACGIASLKINNGDSVTFTCQNLGANSVTLKVTDRAGNVSTCTAIVTVAQAAIIVAGQSTVCQGQSVPLTANLGDSYQWFKNGVAITGATSQNYTATTTGNYTVSVTNAGGCSGTSASTAVTITENPTISVTASGSTDLCQGNTVTLTAGAASFYSWSNGAGTQSITVGTAGSYTVSVFDANGCSATSSPVVVTIKAGALPTASITASGATSFCQGESVVLTAAAANSYEWSNGATSQSITASQSGSYSVKVTNADGCFTTSAPTAVIVKEKPTVNAGQDVTMCNTPTQLNAVGASATPPAPVNTTLCLFDAPGGNGNCQFGTDLCNDGYTFLSSGNYSATTTAGSASTITFKIYYTCSEATFNFRLNGNIVGSFTENGSGCTCAASGQGTYPRTFTFNAAQFQQFWNSGSNTLSVDFSAPGQQVALSGITATIASPGATYSWSPAAGLSNASIANPIANPTTTTTYTVTYALGNGCFATDNVVVNVQCNLPPVARCKPVIVNANPLTCKGSATINQFNNGSSDPDGDAMTFSISPAGPYAIGTTQVTLTVTDSKGASSSCVTTITVRDVNGPAITLPAGITVAAPAGQCQTAAANVTLGTATALDCSGVASITNNAPSVYPVGATIVTWTATDNLGNISQAVQAVNVVSNDPPVLATAPSIVAGACTAINVVAPAATNLCGSNSECITDKIDSYATGNVSGQSPRWTPWDGGESAIVSTAQAFSAPNSVRVSDFQDQLFLLGNKSSGKWTLSWKMYIPAGRVAYYNTQRFETPGLEWGQQVYFNQNDSGILQAAGSNIPFTYVRGQWMDVKQTFNLDADQTTLSINGVAVHTWQFSKLINGNPGSKQIGAIDFFGANGNGNNAVYFIDDISFCGGNDPVVTGSRSDALPLTASYPVGTTTITWTATGGNGASSATMQTVTVAPLPTAAIAVTRSNTTFTGLDNNTIALGYGAQTLTLTASGGGSYTWSTGATTAVINVSPTATTTYTVTVTDQYGCKSNKSVTITVIDVRCGNKMDKVLVCHKTGSAKNPWNQICISPNAVATHLGNGGYLGTCNVASVTAREGITKPVAEEVKATVLSYPNPSRGLVNVRLNSFAAGKVVIQVLDGNGKAIATHQTTVSYKVEDLTLDLSHLSSGVYNLKVSGGKDVRYSKVVIVR
ncbi:MAG: hypothetical protein JWP69_1233 [Flaviaesturariibacter sp.]|nr:hypothetical protein [Flaviaesturariibacter sp.]